MFSPQLTLTLTNNSGVFSMYAVMVAPAVVTTLVKRVFVTGTGDIVEPDLACALTKLRPDCCATGVCVAQLVAYHLRERERGIGEESIIAKPLL